MIKILSDNTINKIAAGEVVERPASVVKELVENAIDAGANKISVILECAGKNLIIVKDNGMGMSKADLALAVQRHATSKLDENDLLNIHTFGFRGEALPAIAAISKFKIISRIQEATTAYTINITGGQVEQILEANLNEGTFIEVRDLFFATPARLKFLRSDKTETHAIVLVMKKIALAHPHICVSLGHDGRELMAVSKATTDGLPTRIASILGNDFINNSAIISFKQNDIEIYGYTSLPTYNRATTDDQYLFINNRPIKDKLLNVALRIAYQNYIARERYPLTVLFIQVPPHFIDVNVHPAKSEVRFHDPNLIRKLVIHAITNALRGSAQKVSSTLSDKAISYIQMPESMPLFAHEKKNQSEQFNLPHDYRKQHHNLDLVHSPVGNYLFQPIPQAADPSHTINSHVEQQTSLLEPITAAGDITTTQIDQFKAFPLGTAKAQIHGTYIISQTKDSIVIVDQHAAHERIGYEKIKEQIAQNRLIKQRLLIPETIKMHDIQRAELLHEHKCDLSELGLTLAQCSENQTSIIVTEVPALIGHANISKLVQDIADYLLSIGENIALSELIEHITATYACHYAIRAGRRLNSDEMNRLLRQMESTHFSGQCNHGRQTYVELKLTDIDKLFCRS